MLLKSDLGNFLCIKYSLRIQAAEAFQHLPKNLLLYLVGTCESEYYCCLFIRCTLCSSLNHIPYTDLQMALAIKMAYVYLNLSFLLCPSDPATNHKFKGCYCQCILGQWELTFNFHWTFCPQRWTVFPEKHHRSFALHFKFNFQIRPFFLRIFLTNGQNSFFENLRLTLTQNFSSATQLNTTIESSRQQPYLYRNKSLDNPKLTLKGGILP